jgi:hypothetical protein
MVLSGCDRPVRHDNKTTTPQEGEVMAARSTLVRLENTAGTLNLRLTSRSLDHGIWTKEPPDLIGDRGHWESESSGFLTGTEGRVSYDIETIDGDLVGEVRLHWDNPFSGSNSYDQSVRPTPDDSDEGFAIGRGGGAGDNAHVTFFLVPGNCTVGSSDGEVEIACAVSSALRTDHERYAAIWEQAAGPSWYALHGLSSAHYQQTFDDLVGRGFRPVQVNGYAVDGEDRYAAIFEQRDGPPFSAHHGLSAAAYQEAFQGLTGRGYRPVHVSGYTVGDEERYAAIFERRDGPPFAARHGLSSVEYQGVFDEFVAEGFRPICVSGYGVAGDDRYAAIFERCDGPPFAARHGLTAEQYQQAFDDLLRDGYRPVRLSTYAISGSDRYAAIFEQRGGAPLSARHGLTPEDYQHEFDALLRDGFRLVQVSGCAVT